MLSWADVQPQVDLTPVRLPSIVPVHQSLYSRNIIFYLFIFFFTKTSDFETIESVLSFQQKVLMQLSYLGGTFDTLLA